VRQQKPGARWDDGRSSAASRKREREVGRSQIQELPDKGYLPHRDRVRRMEGGWRGPSPQFGGQIVDDWLDGHRVYPEPPRPIRDVHRLRRLLARISPPVWLFVLLACAHVGLFLVDVWPSWNWSASWVADQALRLACTCTATLLPAGVLIWRPDAWRSARLVMVGAMVWTTLPAIAGLGWWIARRLPGLMDQFGYVWAVLVAVAAVAAYLGPAVLALGLERARKSRTEWLPYFAQWTTVMTFFATLVSALRWLPLEHDGPFRPLGGGLDPLHLAGSISGAALPLELLCLSILACSCLWAVWTEEAQSRLWQFAAAGATLLVCASIYKVVAGDLLGSVATSGLASRSWNADAATVITLAGSSLVLLAFTSPVWSAAPDAEGPGRPAPDEVFAWGAAAKASALDPIAMGGIIAVATGTDHALALDEHGQVYAWGEDSAGQTDVPDGLSGVIAIAAGDRFSLALRSDGTVVAWGANDLGQTAAPHVAGVIAIAAGSGFALALKADGTVIGWGDGSRGAALVPSELAGVTAISAGECHGLALLANGAVVAWGDNRHGQASVPPRLMRVTSISAGGDFSLALLTNGTVVAWGDNSYGQLDVPRELANVTAISAGAFHALALRADGDVSSWGGGGERPSEAEHPWRLITVKAIAAGDGFSLAIRAIRAT
jgi:hypothetical protein